jgi:ATP-dependent helicase IRC3
LERHDGRALDDVFEKVVFHKTLQEMMAEGWLSPLTAKRIRTNMSVGSVRVSRGDYQASQLSQEINTPERNELIVEQYKRYCQTRRSTLVFCVDIAHVNSLQAAFEASHISCDSITSKTPTVNRDLIMARFRGGQRPQRGLRAPDTTYV